MRRRPVIAGTRTTAQTVIEFLAAGDSPDDIMAKYPSLTREDILACLAYSLRLFSHQPHSQRIELASVLRTCSYRRARVIRGPYIEVGSMAGWSSYLRTRRSVLWAKVALD